MTALNTIKEPTKTDGTGDTLLMALALLDRYERSVTFPPAPQSRTR
jgi:hypothetical protein